MPMGKSCPHCKGKTFHDKDSYHECSNCKYIGWTWNQNAAKVGAGRGNTCPSCKQLTLHDIKQVSKLVLLRRCTTCNYTALEKTRKK